MSTSLTLRWVFGYQDLSGNCFGVGFDEHPEVLVEPIECMCSRTGALLVARDSVQTHLNDRDGYRFDHAVVSFEDLPPTAEYEAALERFVAEHVPPEHRPRGRPRWMLHTDIG